MRTLVSIRTVWLAISSALALCTLATLPLYAEPANNEIEIIRERYPNRSVKVERAVTLDAESNYVNHGSWKMWDEAGKLVAEGKYKWGQRVGLWTRWHDDSQSATLQDAPFNQFQAPFVSQASFHAGQLDGDWLVFDSNQDRCSQITFKGGRRHGPATMWLPGGKVFRQAFYEHGVPVGDLLERGADGKLEKVASYIDGRQVRTKVSYFPGTQEKKTEASYLDTRSEITRPDDFWTARFADYESVGQQLRHGAWRTWYANGQVRIEGNYRNDAEIGTFTWWHPNGQKAVTGEYIKGRQHGQWFWWHANGQKATDGTFDRGAQVGLWRQWKPDGRLANRTVLDAMQVIEGPRVAEQSPTAPAARVVEESFPKLPWMR